MYLTRIIVKLIFLISFASLVAACEQPNGNQISEECELNEPILVQVGNELFRVPIDSKIYISVETTRKGGPLGYFCPQGEPPYKLRRLVVDGDFFLLDEFEFVDSYKVLQFWIYPLLSSARSTNSLGGKYASLKRRYPEMVVEDLAADGSFNVFQIQGKAYFIAKSGTFITLTESPLTLECDTRETKDFLGNTLGYFCITYYRFLPEIGLTYRFYSPKIPDEHWLDLDIAIRSVLESLRIQSTSTTNDSLPEKLEE